MSAPGTLARQRSVSGSSKSRGAAVAVVPAGSAAGASAPGGGGAGGMGLATVAGSATPMPDFTMSPSAILRYFEPCAATAGMFLYAQGNSVVCCHHDTLTIERRFSRHSDEIQLLAVDTQSERGAGRLVVSYDAGQTAIVWDIMSGEEVARFASYEHLTTASWMRNGNVAFGNTQGNIILFEPETSEHISSRTIDQIAVTALAPAADCRTFAIGYQNGSLLICNLQPRFMILHNLTTSRGPSPIVNLAWHASSSRQKSDMLAVQTNDGDLRVWSVAKAYNSSDPAKVVRILKRTENYLSGPNWMGWSKNGRIIQYSENETLSWDVRTKHVTYDAIPTLEHIRGLAVFGPGASLFTLGANNTVQQFDLNAPAMQVANVQHPANLLPPSPPVSIEEQDKAAAAGTSESATGTSESEISIGIEGVSESDEDRLSPLQRIRNAQDTDSDDVIRTASPASSRSQLSSVSSASSRTPGRRAAGGSIQSHGVTEATYISASSSMRSSVLAGGAPERRERERDSYSLSSLSSVSMGSASKARRRPSRLRNEVPRSPEDSRVHDLFKFTKSRLSDIPYKRPPMPDTARLTNDDLRRQMLSIIFGWNKDIQDLVRDEMSRHPVGSPNRILLAKWLGDIDADVLSASSENMTSSDWMVLALSGIGGPQNKLGRAYVQRLLESGDIHAAVTILVGMGDHHDAIEIYQAHKKFMEALILCCLFFPAVWERQAAIVKKWGDWAVLHSHQGLAVRCFACTGKEASEPWRSPSAVQINFQGANPSIPEILSPPLSPPGLQRGPQRSIAKTSALKLITSFGDQSSKAKYFAGQDDASMTPVAGGVTPIAESAISPGVSGEMTAFLRPSRGSAFNTPSSARGSGPAGFGRRRLPSIGEVNDASARDQIKMSDLPTPPVDKLEHTRGHGHGHSREASYDNLTAAMAIGRAATASPMMMRQTHSRRDMPPPPSPSPASMAILMESQAQARRNGSRARIPSGIDMQLQATDIAVISDHTSPEQSVTSSNRYHWPSRRRGPGSVGSSLTSSSSVATRSHHRRAGPDTQGHSLDDYIHSIDAATMAKSRKTKEKSRERSRDGGGGGGESRTRESRTRESSRSRKARSRETSAERGRATARGYTPKAGKRSPRSPVPMSPEDLINLSTPRMYDTRLHDDATIPHADLLPDEPATAVRKSTSAIRHSSKPRAASRTSSKGGATATAAVASTSTSTRRRSPDRRPPALEIPRGRGGSREGSTVRSPSSPLPMSANAQYYQDSDSDDYHKAMREQAKFRHGGVRHPSRESSSQQQRERSQSRRRAAAAAAAAADANVAGVAALAAAPAAAPAALAPPPMRERTPAPVQPAAASAGDLRQMKDERMVKREAAQQAAQRELEERRKSLARRPLAPSIPHPHELSPVSPTGQQPPAGMWDLPSISNVAAAAAAPRDLNDLPPRSHTTEPTVREQGQTRSMYAPRAPAIGLPATPKAMRLVMAGDPRGVPGVPPIPAGFAQKQPSPPGSDTAASSPKKSPQKDTMLASLTLLPSTVYTPPNLRPPIARSMSAPPEEPLAPAALQGHGGSGAGGLAKTGLSRGLSLRKLSTPDVHSHSMAGLGVDRPARRPSADDMIPPPPPPVMLKELAHLASPPPPPPAPLQFLAQGGAPVVYGGAGPASGTIEIVMDDGQTQPVGTAPTPQQSETPIPMPLPPPNNTTTSPRGHHRGRSSVDNSIGARISRATERMRSASRGRNSMAASRTKSPETMVAPYESIPLPAGYQSAAGPGPAPYESVPPPMPPLSFRGGGGGGELRSPVVGGGGQDFRTGLLESEMI